MPCCRAKAESAHDMKFFRIGQVAWILSDLVTAGIARVKEVEE